MAVLYYMLLLPLQVLETSLSERPSDLMLSEPLTRLTGLSLRIVSLLENDMMPYALESSLRAAILGCKEGT